MSLPLLRRRYSVRVGSCTHRWRSVRRRYYWGPAEERARGVIIVAPSADRLSLCRGASRVFTCCSLSLSKEIHVYGGGGGGGGSSSLGRSPVKSDRVRVHVLRRRLQQVISCPLAHTNKRRPRRPLRSLRSRIPTAVPAPPPPSPRPTQTQTRTGKRLLNIILYALHITYSVSGLERYAR